MPVIWHLIVSCLQSCVDPLAALQVGAWSEADVMMRRAAGLGVAPASYPSVGDALAEAARAEMRPLCRAAERWAGLGTHARDALVRNNDISRHPPRRVGSPRCRT